MRVTNSVATVVMLNYLMLAEVQEIEIKGQASLCFDNKDQQPASCSKPCPSCQVTANDDMHWSNRIQSVVVVKNLNKNLCSRRPGAGNSNLLLRHAVCLFVFVLKLGME